MTKTFPCYHLNIAPITDQRTLLSHIILSKTLTFDFHYLVPQKHVSKYILSLCPLIFATTFAVSSFLPDIPKYKDISRKLLISVFSCDLSWCDLFSFLVWPVSMCRWSVCPLSTCSCHPHSFSSTPLTGWPRRTDVLSCINYINCHWHFVFTLFVITWFPQILRNLASLASRPLRDREAPNHLQPSAHHQQHCPRCRHQELWLQLRTHSSHKEPSGW